MGLATIFSENGILLYGFHNYVLTDNNQQLVSKLFKSLCLFLGAKRLTTTAYHLQTNRQGKRYNCTLVARLPHFVSEHQRD